MSTPADPATFEVEHTTRCHYRGAVAFAQHVAVLRPLEDAGQALIDYRLDIEPAPSWQLEDRGPMGNARQQFDISTSHRELCVRARSVVRVRDRYAHIDAGASPSWESVRERLRFQAGAPFEPAAEYTFSSPFAPRDARLRDYARSCFPAGRPLLEGATRLMERIHADLRYETASTRVSTTAPEAFAQGKGVCQDFSHIMIAGLRSIGLAARYVSGYLRTTPVPGGAAMVGADASHAWVAVWCPEQGWVEFDPTNCLVPGTGHVRLACGRDYGDVSPLRGVVQGGGEHTLEVAVSVQAVPG